MVAVSTVAIVGTAAAVVAAIMAIITGVIAARTLEQQRHDSIERSRPMVAAELRPVDDPDVRAQLLVVRNYGQTIARNVRVGFNPPIPDDPEAKILSFMKARYSNPIPTLTPGMELDGVWYMLTLVGAQLVSAEPTPDPCTVTISYESSDGTPYTDEFVLDVSVIANRTWAQNSKKR